ncbi:MAG: N-acetylmuramoyl-L-alanine amidase [Bacteroidota bacterium]
MTATALYIVKAIVCSGILFCYYWFLLRNRSFHSFNRFYLLFTVVLSLCLPFITIDFWQQQTIQSSNVIQMPQVVVAGNGEHADELMAATKTNSWSIQQWILLAYLSVSVVLLFAFARSIFMIIQLAIKNPAKKIDGISLITTTAKNTPFSFLHFVFWNSHIDIDSTNGRQILQHEITHVKGKHSYDKLFMNLLLIICWCNPFYWLIKKELGMIHEFIADKKAVDNNDTSTFAAMILQAAYPQHNFQLTNNFFHSPIKRRLTMLTKNNNTISFYSRILALPLLLFVFAAFTFKTVSQQPIYKGEKTIVVIDAGHGGKDFGAAGIDNVYEKDISLALAKKVKELNSNENIEIILTRETDFYQSPQEKADLVNIKKAALLVSFHADAATKDSAAIKSGINVLVSKDEFPNSRESKVLASAMIETFNKNYPLPVTQNPVQKQGGIWLLKTSKCPSVLIEAGFITNEKDLAFLQSAKGQETIAANILKGIEKYLTAAVK